MKASAILQRSASLNHISLLYIVISRIASKTESWCQRGLVGSEAGLLHLELRQHTIWSGFQGSPTPFLQILTICFIFVCPRSLYCHYMCPFCHIMRKQADVMAVYTDVGGQLDRRSTYLFMQHHFATALLVCVGVQSVCFIVRHRDVNSGLVHGPQPAVWIFWQFPSLFWLSCTHDQGKIGLRYLKVSRS